MAKKWLQAITFLGVEYLEQPLPAQALQESFQLAKLYPNRIALDESIAQWESLKLIINQKWPGWLIIKPLLLGDINSFLLWRQHAKPKRLVYSSVFETMIGVNMLIDIVQSDLQAHNTAHGFGALDYLENDIYSYKFSGPKILKKLIIKKEFEQLWKPL